MEMYPLPGKSGFLALENASEGHPGWEPGSPVVIGRGIWREGWRGGWGISPINPRLFSNSLAGIYEILFKSSKRKAFITCRDVVGKFCLFTDRFAVILWYNG